MVTLNMTPCMFLPWGSLTGAVPNVPEPYWNAVSQEERYKWLFINLDRMKDYLNGLNGFLTDTFSKIEFGSTENITVAANNWIETTISFNESKDETPRIVVTPQCGDGTNITCIVKNVDTTQCIIRIVNNSIQDTDISLSWVAYYGLKKETENA